MPQCSNPNMECQNKLDKKKIVNTTGCIETFSLSSIKVIPKPNSGV